MKDDLKKMMNVVVVKETLLFHFVDILCLKPDHDRTNKDTL